MSIRKFFTFLIVLIFMASATYAITTLYTDRVGDAKIQAPVANQILIYSEENGILYLVNSEDAILDSLDLRILTVDTLYIYDLLDIPSGTTAQRPASPNSGMIRYNTDDNQYEGYDGSNWRGLGGVIDADQDTYIIAEKSSGSDEDTLYFHCDTTKVLTIGETEAVTYIPWSGFQNIEIEENAGEVTIMDMPVNTTDGLVQSYGFGIDNNTIMKIKAPADGVGGVDEKQALFVDGEIGYPGIAFIDDLDTGVDLVGSDSLGIFAGDWEGIRVDGTDSTLDFYGDTVFEDDVILDSLYAETINVSNLYGHSSIMVYDDMIIDGSLVPTGGVQNKYLGASDSLWHIYAHDCIYEHSGWMVKYDVDDATVAVPNKGSYEFWSPTYYSGSSHNISIFQAAMTYGSSGDFKYGVKHTTTNDTSWVYYSGKDGGTSYGLIVKKYNVGIGDTLPQYSLTIGKTSPDFAIFDLDNEDGIIVDTSGIILEANGEPTINMYSSDGDNFEVALNASAQVNFSNAIGEYWFDDVVHAPGFDGSDSHCEWDSLKVHREVSNVVDTGEITFVTGVAGFGEVMIGDNQEWAQIRFTSAGVVTLVDNSTNVTTTNDTDAKLNIYDGGSGIVIENQLGSTLKVAINISYYTP